MILTPCKSLIAWRQDKDSERIKYSKRYLLDSWGADKVKGGYEHG